MLVCGDVSSCRVAAVESAALVTKSPSERQACRSFSSVSPAVVDHRASEAHECECSVGNMRWRARAAPSRAKERANISFFIVIMFFAVFGVIVLTELLLLERPTPGSTRSRYNEDLQVRYSYYILDQCCILALVNLM